MQQVIKTFTKIVLLLALMMLSASAQNTPPRYMILMNNQFSSNEDLKNFINWKQLKGNNVVVVTTSAITAATPGAPTAAEIISYMRGLSANQYPSYLLIIGNENAASGVTGSWFSTFSGGYTDLYYACRSSTDYLPDLYYGRLPASDNAELSTMIAKIIAMDRTPPVTNMYKKIVVAAQIQDADHNNQADRFFCETGDAVACYFEQDISQVGYTCTRAIVNPDNVNANCLWRTDGLLWNSGSIGARVFNTFVTNAVARTRITDNLNAGISLIFHRDHGSHTGWSNPSYDATDVQGLTNGNNRPFVFSVECLACAYHIAGNMGKAWLIHQNGGAAGVIGAVDVSYSGPNDWLTHGLFMGFLNNYRSMHNNSTNPNWNLNLPAFQAPFVEGKSFRLGPMLNCAKMYMYNSGSQSEATFQLYHVFGDPEMEIRMHTPQAITAQYPSQIAVGTSSITVTTNETNLQICLYNPGYALQQTTVTAGNSTTFTISTPGSGYIHTTVTGMNKRPHEGLIQIGTGLFIGGKKMFVGSDGNSHVLGRQSSGALSGFKFGTAASVTNEGNLMRTSVQTNAGAWLDVPGNLIGGIVARAPDGKVHMHISTAGKVTTRYRLTSL